MFTFLLFINKQKIFKFENIDSEDIFHPVVPLFYNYLIV